MIKKKPFINSKGAFTNLNGVVMKKNDLILKITLFLTTKPYKERSLHFLFHKKKEESAATPPSIKVVKSPICWSDYLRIFESVGHRKCIFKDNYN